MMSFVIGRFLPSLIAVSCLLPVLGCASTPRDRATVVEVNGSGGTRGLERAGNVASGDGPVESDESLINRMLGRGGDSDGDGILDDVDKCPNDPEDRDGFQDDDGCSDIDNDMDGISDMHDRCPNEPENKNGIEDEDGCPEATNTDRAKLAFRAGATAYAQNDFATARKYFEEAYQFDPRDPLLYNLARTAEKQGDRNGACRYYRQWRASPSGASSTDSITTLETCP